jgi:predicted MFS family arabinose efflux permease
MLSVGAFAASANIRIMDPLIPPLSNAFGVTAGQLALVVTGFVLCYGLMQLVWGPIGDRFGKLRLAASASAAAGVATAACALAPSVEALAVMRALAGLVSAAVIPTALAHIGDAVPYERRQATLARLLMGVTLGLVAGQALAGIVSEHYGWRPVFVLVGVLFLVAAAGLALSARGALPPAPPTGSLADSYRAQMALLGRPWVRRVVLTVAAEGAVLVGFLTFVGATLHDRHALDYGTIGLLLAIYGGGGLAYASAAPWFIRRYGEVGLARRGSVVAAAGYLILIGLAAVAPPPALLVPFAACATFAIGLGFMMLHNTLQTRATQMAPDTRGAAVALFAACFFLGQTVGVGLGGPVYDRFGALGLFAIAVIALPVIGWSFAAAIRQQDGAAG